MEAIIQEQNKIQFFNETDLFQKQHSLRKKSFQGLCKNYDGTHNIVHDKNLIPEVGQIVNTYNFQLMVIIEVISTRKHKGVYKNEDNRENVSCVSVAPLLFEKLNS
ncbi:hypothetical protein [Chryseobacterium aureum]|uniref:hypothetical protein n=1 Tax=Chryseobacterium aureum TaxID=2497456 RepID=UPI000F86A3A4|nr:hypothetical protein [Chryseobacterium aureum]